MSNRVLTAGRFFCLEPDGSEKLLFDAQGQDLSISPDGKKALFTRANGELYRKGYRGPRSSQIWLYDFAEKTYEAMIFQDWGRAQPALAQGWQGFLLYRWSERLV